MRINENEKIENNSLDDETIDTTIDVDVDELWTRTVVNNPTINPASGFDKTDPSLNTCPVILPWEKKTFSFFWRKF